MLIRLHFIRELIAIGLIRVLYVKTTENSADFLTKPTGRVTIKKSLVKLAVIQVSDTASNRATRSMEGCENSSSGERGHSHKLRKVPRTKPAAENVSANVSGQIRLKKNPGPQSLKERITVSAKGKTVENNQTNQTDTAQRDGETIDNVASLLSRFAEAT
ncbi:hypothetical protein PTTG_30842 [Puccinia triticina 1-1 BBBD Race 1]|uniref:Uncharacterized protein n=1 Tax=Puccinia triticina (isolate 1-1 / race 1 (BBBD)) TaxID=630390 RepID=A0A180FZP3_PUCT1|nr:hypothetical protein PTTG_30842 [Puccinia triticina 1-1 BBBD Race 1]